MNLKLTNFLYKFQSLYLKNKGSAVQLCLWPQIICLNKIFFVKPNKNKEIYIPFLSWVNNTQLTTETYSVLEKNFNINIV